MAASDSQLAAGRSLAGDLRAIRRKHGIDLKEVLDATRLADDVIEQLEENALVNHPAFNRVYLRSLFGAYGEAVGIKRADIVEAIEQVFEGHYVGSLARTYLGQVVDEEDVDAILTVRASGPEEPETGGGIEDQLASEVPVESQDAGDPTELADSVESANLEDPDALLNEAEAVGTDMDSEGESPRHEDSDVQSYADGDGEAASPRAPIGDEADPASGETAEHQDLAPDRHPVGSQGAGPSGDENVWAGLADRKTVLLPNMSGTALVVIAGIAFVALLWFAVSTVMNLGSDDETELVAQDTSAVEEIFRPERVILPDTIQVAIIAFTEPLDPIRITADRDLRKPYWVELMDTHRVAVTNRLQLEREADHTRVLVDGFAIPEDWLLEDDPVDISRNRVQTWLDSLVAAGIAPQRVPPPPPTAGPLSP